MVGYCREFPSEVEHLVEADHRLTGHDIIERECGLDHRRDRVETIDEQPITSGVLYSTFRTKSSVSAWPIVTS